MEDRSSCLHRIERLVSLFLQELNEERLMPLRVPQLATQGDIEDILGSDDSLWNMFERSIYRSIISPQTTRSYAQITAVLALVAELQTRKSSQICT